MLNKLRGFSISELMIATTIGLILIGMLFETFGANSVSNQIDTRRAYLNVMVYDTLNQITSELRRANGWKIGTIQNWDSNYEVQINTSEILTLGSPHTFPVLTTAEIGPLLLPVTGTGVVRLIQSDGIGSSADIALLQSFDGDPPPAVRLAAGQWGWVSPFSYSGDTTNKFQILTDVSTASCILFTYDKYGDGVINTTTKNDRFGFRLASENGYGVIQMRTGGSVFNCTPGVNNTWINITNANEINISSLQFTDAPLSVTVNGRTLKQHQVIVNITANLVNDTKATVTKDETVFIRNLTIDS